MAYKKPYLFLAIAMVLLSFNFLNLHLDKLSRFDGKEKFDPGLLRLNSINKLTGYIDSIAHLKNINQPDTAYFQIANDVMQGRFFHGYSSYSLSENWVSALADKLVCNGINCIVNPGDLIKYPMAACSQQAIVFAEIARKKKIPYRKILFAHHYCMELFISNQWFFYDTNMEPGLNNTNRNDSILEDLNRLRTFYPAKYSRELLDTSLIKVERGKPNEPLTPNASIFHNTTLLFSKFAWVLPFIIFMQGYRKNKKIQYHKQRENIEKAQSKANI